MFAKYPQVNCEIVWEAHYQEGAKGYTLLEKFANKEWQDYYNVTTGQEKTPFAGPLQCYCEQSRLDWSPFHEKYLQGDPLCKEYNMDYWISLAASNGVSYFIVGTNYFLRVLIIYLIIYIGKDTESEQTRLITYGVFIV